MNDFKIKIFILTLKQNNLRRSKLLDQLDKMHLPYQLWFGIDGTKKLPLKKWSIKTVQQFFADGKKSNFNI